MDSIQKKIYVYIHICTIGNWEQVVRDLFSKLTESGLLNFCTEIRVGVLGEQLQQVKEILPEKSTIIFHSLDITLYERPTLEQLRKDAESDDFYALYIHSKGIREKNAPYRDNIQDWIDVMCYFLMSNYTDCLKLLDTHADAVGTILLNCNKQLLVKEASIHDPAKAFHFSGNFWWSKSSYLRTTTSKIGPKYIDPEIWIGSGKGTLYSRHQTHFQHYYKNYPPSRYVGKFNKTRIVKLK